MAWSQEKDSRLIHSGGKSATPENSSQQDDNDSCGIFTCWHATARVLGIGSLHLKNHHIPQMRLHIYHCFAADLLFTLTLAVLSDDTLQRVQRTTAWYANHRVGYNTLQNKRRARVHIRPIHIADDFLPADQDDTDSQVCISNKHEVVIISPSINNNKEIF